MCCGMTAYSGLARLWCGIVHALLFLLRDEAHYLPNLHLSTAVIDLHSATCQSSHEIMQSAIRVHRAKPALVEK